MTPAQQVIFSCVLAAVGLWLMLPPHGRRAWALGAVATAVGLGLLAARMPALGSWAAAGTFYVLAGVTVAAAVGTVASRNPVYSALWFAVSLLGAAALFMVDGAEFLGVATIVVYAGAIVVTFLFVLMLAQPDGTAFYDRIGWGWVGSLASSVAGAAIVGILTLTLAGTLDYHAAHAPSDDALQANVLVERHVRGLGGELFTRHLLSVEVAGTLLLVALVGAIAIVARGKAAEKASPGSLGADGGDPMNISPRGAPAGREGDRA